MFAFSRAIEGHSISGKHESRLSLAEVDALTINGLFRKQDDAVARARLVHRHLRGGEGGVDGAVVGVGSALGIDDPVAGLGR